MKTYLVVGLCIVLATLCLSVPVLAQRADRGIITGIVTDPSGSAVAGAEVKVRNEETGVETALVSNGSGAYTTPPLPLGTYTVTVDHTGFKKAVKTGIELQGSATIRQDVTLALGAVTESVEVKAEAELNVTTPDISHTVDERYYKDIPTITAADVRLAEAVLQIQPGYPSHEAERRPHVPRQPIQLPHQRRADDGDRELLRWCSVWLCRRTPAESGERAPDRKHPGSQGHHDLLTPHSTATPAVDSSSTPPSQAPTLSTEVLTNSSPTMH